MMKRIRTVSCARALLAAAVGLSGLAACSSSGDTSHGLAQQPADTTGGGATAENAGAAGENGENGENEEEYSITDCSIGQLVAIAEAVDATQINAANIALEKSSDPRVKKVAQSILDGYTRSNHAMMSSGIEPVAGDVADAITVRGDQLVKTLRSTPSASFDRSFVSNELLEQLSVLSMLQNVSLGEQPSAAPAGSTTAPSHTAHPHMTKAIRHVRKQLKQLVALQRQLVGACGTPGAGCAAGECEDAGADAAPPTYDAAAAPGARQTAH